MSPSERLYLDLGDRWPNPLRPNPVRPDTVRLEVRGHEPQTQITLINSALQPIASEQDLLIRDLPPGLYKLRFQVGALTHELYQALELENPVVRVQAPRAEFDSPAPLEGTRQVIPAHSSAAQERSRIVDVRHGSGGRLFIFVRDWNAPGSEHPGTGLTLHDLTGQQLVDLSNAGTWEKSDGNSWTACNIELMPGSYRLRVDAGQEGVFEQSIVVCERWQTQVFLLRREYGLQGQRVWRADLADAAIFIKFPQEGFQADDPVARTEELARLALRQRQPYLPRRQLEERPGRGFDDPMLGLYAAHSLLVGHATGQQLSPAQLRTLDPIVDRLSRIIPDHPDVDALRLWLGKSPAASFRGRYAQPPMFLSSWSLIVEKTAEEPSIVPAGSWAARFSRDLWGHGPWLIWQQDAATASPQPSPPESEFDEVEQALLASLRKRQSSPDPKQLLPDSVSIPPLVRHLGLPWTVIEAAIAGLRQKLRTAPEHRHLKLVGQETAPQPLRGLPQRSPRARFKPRFTHRVGDHTADEFTIEGRFADESTIGIRKRNINEPVARLVPTLTIVSHPMAHRVGERLLLEGVLSGRAVEVSRNAPDFMRPDAVLGTPLADPFLSRKPIVFSQGPGGCVRLSPGDGIKVALAGEVLREPWEFSPEELAEGVALELAERVVVLLHWADPSANATVDALGLVGTSFGIQQVRHHIEQVADLNVPVLVRGETGSGKELIARSIHQRSQRRDKSFMSVNMGAIPKELAPAELFGVARGPFTGAAKDREGVFRAAHDGSLFLDEVDEAPPEVQAMLLRVLETGEIFPVGERTPVKMGVRLIASTDAQLERQVQEGLFKEPLLHRLAEYVIRVPPLRERREDIGLLFHHFAREELESIGEAWRLKPDGSSTEPWLPAALASRLVRFGWPGNIRQLRNFTRQLIIGSRGHSRLRVDPRLEKELESSLLPRPGHPATKVAAEIVVKSSPTPKPPAEPKAPARRRASDVSETELLAALRESAWDLKAAADRLGIPRSSIYNLIDKNPRLRTAGDLSVEEITRCFQECGGDLEAMAQRLEVSQRALGRRIKELGLVSENK